MKSNLTDLKSIFENFKINRFDPTCDNESCIATTPGNYILCLRKGAKVPTYLTAATFTQFEGLKVIYTGITRKSLRTRDYRTHFKGNNAGRSTLRKSLGVLFEYKQIPRDKLASNGKTKFEDHNEQTLTEWMTSNLILFLLPNSDFKKIELILINHFNPPLNLKDNYNNTNADFRRLLSNLRTQKNK
jgi:hypothetical protein